MGACFCTGACRVTGRCPNMIENMGQPIEWPKIIPPIMYPPVVSWSVRTTDNTSDK